MSLSTEKKKIAERLKETIHLVAALICPSIHFLFLYGEGAAPPWPSQSDKQPCTLTAWDNSQ